MKPIWCLRDQLLYGDEDPHKKINADFQCFVCGAIFTSEEDRRQHLEKEMHGAIENKDIDIEKRQTDLRCIGKRTSRYSINVNTGSQSLYPF